MEIFRLSHPLYLMNISKHLTLTFGVAFLLFDINRFSCSAENVKMSSDEEAVAESSLKRDAEVTVRVPGIGRARYVGEYGRRVINSGRAILSRPLISDRMEHHRPIVLNHRYRQAYG